MPTFIESLEPARQHPTPIPAPGQNNRPSPAPLVISPKPKAQPRKKTATKGGRRQHPRAKGTFLAMADRYHRQNLEASEIIVTNVEKYGGESSGVVISARLALARERERQASL